MYILKNEPDRETVLTFKLEYLLCSAFIPKFIGTLYKCRPSSTVAAEQVSSHNNQSHLLV